MSQCVPSWDLDDNPLGLTASTYSNSVAPESLSSEYEVAELTWENGQLAMHGLAPSRVGHKPAGASSPAWDKPPAGGTLESIVNQATKVNDLAPWFDHRRAFVKPAAGGNMSTMMDALVPCNNVRTRNEAQLESSTHVLDSSAAGIGTCMVGSCSVSAAAARGRNNASVSESDTCGGDSRQMTLDSSEREFGGGGGGLTSTTSLWSPENTSSGGDTKTSGEDSVFRRRSQRDAGEKGKKKGNGKNSNSAKSRAAAIHNQSERKRRDKINQRMKTLQKLVPNSSKTDKASMLDEVIEYLKQLQAQVQMMSRMSMPTMMMQQQLHMSMMAQAMGMGMGVMDINSIGRAAAMPPVIPNAATPAAFMQMPMPSWDHVQAAANRLPAQPVVPDFLSAFINCQSQPMTIDAYSRMAAMYQQFQQPPGTKN